MNGEGRTQRGGRVPANDYGDEPDDKEARVACLSSDSENSFVTASEGLQDRDYSVLECTAPLEGQAEPYWIGNWGMAMEAAEEGILSMEKHDPNMLQRCLADSGFVTVMNGIIPQPLQPREESSTQGESYLFVGGCLEVVVSLFFLDMLMDAYTKTYIFADNQRKEQYSLHK